MRYTTLIILILFLSLALAIFETLNFCINFFSLRPFSIYFSHMTIFIPLTESGFVTRPRDCRNPPPRPPPTPPRLEFHRPRLVPRPDPPPPLAPPGLFILMISSKLMSILLLSMVDWFCFNLICWYNAQDMIPVKNKFHFIDNKTFS